ncbi:MAG TPA: hypothetical protein VFS40_09615 [Gemmatimonadales bacterium]|nr:hypothetical protein [Gemmatimonadales bacterium]
MRRRSGLLLGLLVLGRAAPAAAQVRAAPLESWSPPAPAGHGDARPSRADDPDAALRRARPAALVGGVLGAAFGLWGGLEFGDYAAEHLGWRSCCGDDPGLEAHVIGGALGSVLGTFLGVTAGTQAAGVRPADVQRRLAGAIGGTLTGLVTAAIVTTLAQSGDRSLLIPSFAVGQGIFAAVIGTARHASADSTIGVR